MVKVIIDSFSIDKVVVRGLEKLIISLSAFIELDN